MRTQERETDTKDLAMTTYSRMMTPTLRRYAEIIRRGKRAQLDQFAKMPMSSELLFGRLTQLGFARLVRHRDHTQTWELTLAGREALSSPDPREGAGRSPNAKARHAAKA